MPGHLSRRRLWHGGLGGDKTGGKADLRRGEHGDERGQGRVGDGAGLFDDVPPEMPSARFG